MNCEPDNVMEGARCFEVIPPGETMAVIIYLLCLWANET